MRRYPIILVALVALTLFCAADNNRTTLGDLAAHAIQQSKITLPGSKPFHLLATIVETTNPDSEYHAKIEEFWLSATKWRRTIQAPGFSQTLIVNGESVSEQNTGDYFPHWLNNFVTAIFDPVPMLDALNEADNPGTVYLGPRGATVCPEVRADVDRWIFCFESGHGLLTSVFTRGYAMEFGDFKQFGTKRVPRRIDTDPEPGTHLQGVIVELEELSHPDERMFAVQESTPAAEPIKSVRISQDELRRLSLNGTEIAWPSVGEGLTTGGCAVYVSADRKGIVREVWPGGCDNAGLEDSLRDQVRTWRLKPATVGGVPVQVESLVTFTFHTIVEKSKALPNLSDAEVRRLATYIVEPVFPSGADHGLTDVVVQISVDETGTLTGVGSPQKLPDLVFAAAYVALTKWKFRPYVLNGKPQYFHGEVIFHIQPKSQADRKKV